MWYVGEPLTETQRIDGDGCQHVSEMDTGEPDVACPPQVAGADTAREGAFDAGASRIFLSEVLCPFALTGGL